MISTWACSARAVRCLAGLGLLFMAAGSACVPVDGNGDGNGNANSNANDNSGQTGETGIVNTQSNFALSSLSPSISIIYNALGSPDMVSGIFVELDSTGAGGAPTVITGAEDLAAGSSQSFLFDPEQPGIGVYRVGILVQTGETSTQYLSSGIIQIQGPPDPLFIQPADDVTEVAPGSTVTISFDAGDPENDVQWRLFYLTESDPRNVTPDRLGTQLATGSGNVGQSTFATVGLEPGDYEIGVSATDSGVSVAATVENEEFDRIVTIPDVTTGSVGPIVRIVEPQLPQPPTISITAPGSSQVSLFLNEAFNIVFAATIREPGANGLVDVFYDSDSTFNNGFTAIARDLPASQTSVPLPTNLPEGTYHIGASVSDGINPVVFTYAAGTVRVVRTPTLDVTAPNTDLPIPPSAATGTPNTITVSWTTNVPASPTRTVDVFARAVNASGAATGPEIVVQPPRSLTTTSAQFSSPTSGVFAIFVRIIFGTNESPTLTDQSPKPVRVSSLPRILWLGSLAVAEPEFEGAIFGGVNFEDNAGTAFTGAGDLNGDGADEFVINSRYGKPFFVNPSGVGPGEAYVVYGRTGSSKLLGSFNLNSIGLSNLRGVSLSGVGTVGNSDDTDGLSDVTQIPDADGDGLGELVFGFPRTNSAGFQFGRLEASGQFLNGGVVILSSSNDLLAAPDEDTPVIDLGAVGQRFSNTTVTPALPYVEDQLVFSPGDPTAMPPTGPGCIDGTDEFLDTIIGPGVGFNSVLAPPGYLFEEDFEFIPATTAPAPLRCPTQVELPDECISNGVLVFHDGGESGSGFYPATSQVLDPNGARIIGKDRGDGFGTSVTSSIPIGTTGPGDLIISAPRRSATTAEIDGLSGSLGNAGIAYLADNLNRWPVGGNTATRPFQFIVGTASHCGPGQAPNVVSIEIAGGEGDAIQNVLGIRDFNRDGRNDIAVGAPNAGDGKGRVYVAFRREAAIEGDVVLRKLELAPTNPERLTGVLITTQTDDGLGTSLASGVDFNGDGVSDLVIGSPNAAGGVGEVVIVFGDPNLTSPENGITVQTLLASRDASGLRPRAARIKGNTRDVGGNFGFNVANAGDVDGDGKNDLLIAAPNASPRFDPNPTNATDELTDLGLDQDFDGIKDDVSGPFGTPDGRVDTRDDLPQSGIVYLISSRNRLDLTPRTDVTVNIAELGSSLLSGFMIVGRRAGDRIAGGDAGDTAQGGIAAKSGRGRSKGLASAGDVDADNRADILIGSILADPRIDPNSGMGIQNGGEAYLIYGTAAP